MVRHSLIHKQGGGGVYLLPSPENDDVWVELRHQHIAEVSKQVYDKFQTFATKKKLKHQGDPDVSTLRTLTADKFSV